MHKDIIEINKTKTLIDEVLQSNGELTEKLLSKTLLYMIAVSASTMHSIVTSNTSDIKDKIAAARILGMYYNNVNNAMYHNSLYGINSDNVLELDEGIINEV
ncbi:MAG: hypothetical protein KatS3mg083_101 [Candidatus Dojkabacteria bacterium]|nr:MAG: hypothetical protein KatS3mg083_101 [Candidatus Dojkabacteria bacterium]